MADALELVFDGPFHLAGGGQRNVFMNADIKKAGLYLMTVETAVAGMVARYVGETGNSFEKRLKEHVIHILGGNYRIADVESMRQMSETVLWDGLWRRGRTKMTQDFIDLYVELAPHIKRYLEAYRIFLAPISNGRLTLRQRRLIEGALARHLRHQQNLMAADIRYWSRRRGETAMKVEIKAVVSITGLPETLWA